MPKPPPLLLAAFREVADKEVESIACLLIEEAFDAETMRVLAAWGQTEVGWRAPKDPCPDDGKPTPAAWRWLTSGLEVDYDALAEASGTTRRVARAKAAMLLGNHLVFPDGSVSTPARGALQSHARRALGIKAKEKKPPAAPAGGAN